MKRTKKYEFGGDVESDYGPTTGRGASGTSETIEAPIVPTKPKMVTKEELAASGMNLRDYMNKQQGLTRRGESAPAPTPKIEEAEKPTPKAANTLNAEEYRAATTPSKSTKAKTAQAERDAEMAARREKTMGTLRSAGSFLADLPGKAMENYRSTVPRYNKEKKMASGGKVSSASSRGDGIAQRGKTRGKMC
jgi:hypothetical protein